MSNKPRILLMAITYFLVNMQQFALASILDSIAGAFNVSVAVAGQLGTAYAVSFAVGTPLMMLVLARLDQRTLFLVSLSALLGATLLMIGSPSFGILLASRVLVGLASGVTLVAGTDLITSIVIPKNRGNALYTLALGASLAVILGMPLSRMLAELYDWKVIFLGLAILYAMVIVTARLIIPSTTSLPVAPLKQQLSYLGNRAVLVTLFVCNLNFVGYSMLFTYIIPYLGSTQVPLTAASLVLSALGIASFIGSKTGGWLVGKIGAIGTLKIGVGLQALFLVLVSLSVKIPIFTILFLICWIFNAWMTGQTFNLLLITEAPEASRIMLSLGSSAIQLGFAIGAAVGGMVISTLAAQSLTWVSAVFAVSALGISMIAFKTSGVSHGIQTIEGNIEINETIKEDSQDNRESEKVISC